MNKLVSAKVINTAQSMKQNETQFGLREPHH